MCEELCVRVMKKNKNLAEGVYLCFRQATEDHHQTRGCTRREDLSRETRPQHQGHVAIDVEEELKTSGQLSHRRETNIYKRSGQDRHHEWGTGQRHQGHQAYHGK
ncbi:uncharacterized protein LOC143281548 [Babylonia areolata]|uniref:uncharacterized protein LOC143281548 n=1 Tax=Babylonia areolata TaxID=304850 RepID=UPI003FD5F145